MSALTPGDRMRAEREIVRIVSGTLYAQGCADSRWITSASEAITTAVIDQYLEPVVEDLSAVADELRRARQVELA